MAELHTENLISLADRTTEEQRKIASKGGKASGKARREKKFISQMMAELIAEEHDIKIDGVLKKLTGEKLLKRVWMKILAEGGSSAVSLTKVFVDATEGSKIKNEISGLDGSSLAIQVYVNPAKSKE